MNNLETLYKTDPVKACELALRRTSKVAAEQRIEEINSLLHGYGTEAVRGEWQNGYWCDIVAVYVNMGDTYSTTVVHIRDVGFRVMSWGDFVERYSKKLGIQ